MNIKELSKIIDEKKTMSSGHRTCAGCPIGIICRTITSASDKPVVCSSATSCAEVTTTIYPETSWNIPWIHSVFANSAATISGIETSYKYLKKKGKIKKDINFLVIAGDGGSYDIGLQALSGALERGHDFVYVCYNNEGYQNTGAQRSSATPKGATTTTTPLGKNAFGKVEVSKDLAKIAIAHSIPYVAQANTHNLVDLYNKAQKAFLKKGPAVIVVFAACPTNMKAPSNKTIEISRLATESNFWPLYEYEDGKLTINYKPEKRIAIEEFLKTQTKFKEILKEKNKETLKSIQKDVDDKYEELLKLEKI